MNREWPYKNVKPRIIAEQYMEDEKTAELRDYKFFSFDGETKAMFIASDRASETEETKFDFFDMDYNHLPFTNGHPNAKVLPEKPERFDEMHALADKLSVGILLGLGKYIQENKINLPRRTYAHITVYEEVGHGGCASVPAGVTEALVVDMGCVGEGLECTERMVSICAKDSSGPFNREIVIKLAEAAERAGASYAVDVYPHYSSDVATTLKAGFDIRHGLIGAGVYASHGYERSHKDGVENTLKLLVSYLTA